MKLFGLEKQRAQRREVLETLVYNYSSLLLMNAKMYLQDDYLAEDVVQEVWLFVWEFFERLELDDKKRLEGYLMTMVKHKCLNLIQKRQRERSYDLLDEANSWLLQDTEDTDFKNLEYREALELLGDVLKRDDVTLLWLYYHYGFDYSEISDMLGLKEATLRKRVSRARKKAQKKLPDFALEEGGTEDEGRQDHGKQEL